MNFTLISLEELLFNECDCLFFGKIKLKKILLWNILLSILIERLKDTNVILILIRLLRKQFKAHLKIESFGNLNKEQ